MCRTRWFHFCDVVCTLQAATVHSVPVNVVLAPLLAEWRAATDMRVHTAAVAVCDQLVSAPGAARAQYSRGIATLAGGLAAGTRLPYSSDPYVLLARTPYVAYTRIDRRACLRLQLHAHQMQINLNIAQPRGTTSDDRVRRALMHAFSLIDVHSLVATVERYDRHDDAPHPKCVVG